MLISTAAAVVCALLDTHTISGCVMDGEVIAWACASVGYRLAPKRRFRVRSRTRACMRVGVSKRGSLRRAVRPPCARRRQRGRVPRGDHGVEINRAKPARLP